MPKFLEPIGWTHSSDEIPAVLGGVVPPAPAPRARPRGGVTGSSSTLVGPEGAAREEPADREAVVVPGGNATRCDPRLPVDRADSPDILISRPEIDELADRFEFIGEIARGGMGVVFRGRDLRLGREVAIKLLRNAHADLAEVRGRFLAEGQIAAQLQHPGIVPIYEMGRVEGGRPYIVMKLIRGRTLAEILAGLKGDPKGQRDLVALLLKACQAVAYAHSRRVVHRDLKPSNIMVGRFGQVRVMDWGLARVRPSPADDPGPSAGRGRIVEGPDEVSSEPPIERVAPEADASAERWRVGTPAYMAPEQALGDDARVDERSDVFGLGAILYEILTGSPPFQDEDPETIYKKLLEATPTPPRVAHPGVSRDIETICMKCLSRDPDSRYPDARALAEELERFLNGLPVASRPLGALGRLGLWCRRNSLLALASAIALVASVLLGVGGLRAAIVESRLRERAEIEAGRSRMTAALARSQRDSARAEFRTSIRSFQALIDSLDQIDPSKPDPELIPRLKRKAAEAQIKTYEEYLARPRDEAEPKVLTAWCVFNLGRLRAEFGPVEQSRTCYSRALELSRSIADDPSLSVEDAIIACRVRLDSGMGLGAYYGDSGRLEMAIRLWEESDRDAGRYRRRFPGNQKFWESHYATLGNLAEALRMEGRHAESAEVSRRREIMRKAGP